MADRYLNPEGLSRVWNKIKGYVDSVTEQLQSRIEALEEPFRLYDFQQAVNGTLLPVTSDTAISGSSTGRIELDIGAEMAEKWAIASLCKWEVFNGSSRIDAIPMYEFSMETQRKLRIGFRTSGSSSKSFTKIQGALLLKRR